MWPSAAPRGVPEGWDRACVHPDHLQGPKCVCAEQALCPQAVSMTPLYVMSHLCGSLWRSPHFSWHNNRWEHSHGAWGSSGHGGHQQLCSGDMPGTWTHGHSSARGAGPCGGEWGVMLKDRHHGKWVPKGKWSWWLHRMTESQNILSWKGLQGSWSACLEWPACTGIQGTAVMLSAPCSAQQTWS